MPLTGTLEKLYARRRFGIRPGLDRVQLMLDRLDHPEKSFPSIHVVGTNGKGSTSAFLSAILTAAGRRTALFTSPHLISFSERFRINGAEANPDRLLFLLDRVLEKAPEEATFFEIVTCLGALYFAEERAEVAIMEAGMGGRSDATAAIPGIMTLITPISLDHCEYLGGDVAAIAAEKAAMAEPGTPVVSAAQAPAALDGIVHRCGAHNNRLTLAGRDFLAQWEPEGTLGFRNEYLTLNGLRPGIPGRYQVENAGLALAAAGCLPMAGTPISPETAARGLAAASWPGRMETVSLRPRVVLDGCHNLAGVAAMVESLDEYRYGRLLAVLGMMQEKDVEGMLTMIGTRAAAIYAVTPSVERALPSAALADLAVSAGIPARDAGTVAAGFRAAAADAAADDLVLVCGSLFTVGEVRALLHAQPFQGIRG